MKRKIGIITINGVGCNFGGKLQNYAMQTILERLEYDVETIQDTRFCKNPLRLLTYKKALVHYISRYKYVPTSHKKPLSFFFWKKRYIKYCPIVIRKEKDECKLLKRFDGYVVGSDQIWGSLCPWDSNELSFLSFAPKNQRVAYAPSFGQDYVIDNRKDEYRNALNDFHALSVREYAGASIIKDLTGKDVPVLLDPTMLLTTEQWDSIATSGPLSKYILVYTLGELTPEYSQFVTQVSIENQWDIIDINKDDSYSGGSPSDFIGLVRGAQMVVTDSFHGCVFSLLYHRPLVMLERKDCTASMNSRQQTLKQTFKITTDSTGDIEVLNINWDGFEQILSLERDRSLNYLIDSLSNI